LYSGSASWPNKEEGEGIGKSGGERMIFRAEPKIL